MTLDLARPEWWSKDVPFDPTGKTQLGWAREAAAQYRAAAGKAPGRPPAKERVFDALKAEMGVTEVATGSVTNVTGAEQSVTVVAGAERSVTNVTVSKGASRAKRFREKNRAGKEE